MKIDVQDDREYLPPDMIREILSKLPTKSLRRFECVSKPWRSELRRQRRRFLFTVTVRPYHHLYYSLDLDQFLQNHQHQVTNNNNHISDVDSLFIEPATELHPRYSQCRPISSCNSFLLSHYSSSQIILINPATKDLREIELSPYQTSDLLYGFGIDYSTGEYKVVNGLFYYTQKDYPMAINVYTLGTGSWRRVGDQYPYLMCTPCTDHQCYEGIVLNGCVHWMVAREINTHTRKPVMISFHFSEEKVREIPLPPAAALDCTCPKILGVFRDWLCITFISGENCTHNEFWVMKKYGLTGSWTKMFFHVPYDSLSHSGFWSESHDLMVFNRSKLLMYNFTDHTFWELCDIDKVVAGGRFYGVNIFYEDLHTSFADQEQRKKRRSDLQKKKKSPEMRPANCGLLGDLGLMGLGCMFALIMLRVPKITKSVDFFSRYPLDFDFV